MKAMSRPAQILSSEMELDQEFRSARWAYHRLLDFEDKHQRLLDKVQEWCVPGMSRVAKIVARLRGRRESAKRATRWMPGHHPEWLSSLEKRLDKMRKLRNQFDLWKRAIKWPDTPGPGCSEKGTIRRKAGESDEDFAERAAKRDNRRSRREHYRTAVLYPQIRVHYDTFNALVDSANRAKSAVLGLRTKGLPAEWRRPRWSDPNTLFSGASKKKTKKGETVVTPHWKIVERGKLWWVIEMPAHHGPIRFRAKFGNWHDIPDDAVMTRCSLTRRKKGNSWEYTASIAVDLVGPAPQGRGVVGIDWGHREHGHPRAREGIRVFTWVGDDGASGEIILPKKCRDLLDKKHDLQSRVDLAFRALGVPDRNRFAYRKRLERSGVRTHEESEWLRWESRRDWDIHAAATKAAEVRKEVYLAAARQLASRYHVIAIEDEPTWTHRKNAKEEQTKHRKRQNRELSARYLFRQCCERYGVAWETVPARNTTRECPSCGHVNKNVDDFEIVCESCGVLRDRDYGAAEVILKRFLSRSKTTS